MIESSEEFQAWLTRHDDNERIDSELTDILGEEFQEEYYRDNIILEAVE